MCRLFYAGLLLICGHCQWEIFYFIVGLAVLWNFDEVVALEIVVFLG